MSKLYFECRFNSFELSSLDLPIEIRKPNIVLVTRCRSSQPIELKPGIYYVMTKLPTGEELYSKVQLSEGKDLLVIIRADSEHHTLNEAQEMHRFLGAPGLTALQISRHLEPQDASDNNLPLHSSERLIARLRVYWDYLFSFLKKRRERNKYIEAEIQVFRGNVLQGEHKAIPADEWLVVPPGAHHITAKSSKPTRRMKWFGTSSPSADPHVAEFSVLSDNDVQLVQLLQPNVPAINTMLPGSRYHRSRLFLTQFPNGNCTVDIQLANNSANLLLRYLRGGLIEQSTALIDSPRLISELLLNLRQEDPIAATIGAYALLRYDDLERLEYFLNYLGDKIEWLPDSVAIRGEYLARIGDDDQALVTFLDLPSKGLPIFSDGLSYAIDRLRLYISLGEDCFENTQLLKAQAVLKRLQKFAFFVDFRQPLLTFNGVDPGEPSNGPPNEDMASYSGLDVAMLLSPAKITYRAFIRNIRLHKVVALISAFFKRYGTSIAATGVVVPIVAALATALFSILLSLSPVPALGEEWYTLLGGSILTGIVWVMLAICCYPFGSPERANRRSYTAFHNRLRIVKAQLGVGELKSDNPTLEDLLRTAKVDPDGRYSLVALREAYDYCMDASRRIRERGTGFQWIAGTGYNHVWSLLHRAEEALIEVEPTALAIRGAIHDKARIQGSSMKRRKELIRVLKQAVADSDASDKTDDAWAFEDGKSSGSGMLQKRAIARGVSRLARKTLNVYRDNLWEGLVRARNQLLGLVVITGLVTYILLCISIFISNHAVIVEAITIYLTGSIAGLIRPLYEAKRRKTSIHNYGFSWIYIIAAGLFAGLVSVVGLLLLDRFYFPDLSTLNILAAWSNIFRPDKLLNLPVAAAFGLVSNLYFRNIRRRVEKIESNLKSSNQSCGVLLEVS